MNQPRLSTAGSHMDALRVMAGCLCITLVLGSIHAFSILLQPWEARLSAPRADVSLVYSLALITLTLAVLFGHRVYALIRPAGLVAMVMLCAVLGVVVASRASTLPGVWLGYSGLFGLANGLGYGFALQLSAQALPHRRGFAMGTVTAFYALGAALFSWLLEQGISRGGVSLALHYLALALVVIGLIAVVLLHSGQARYRGEGSQGLVRTRARDHLDQFLLWAGYGSGALAGLMAIGHATGIAQSAGATPVMIVMSPMLLAVANMIGGLGAGGLADRFSVTRLLIILPLTSAMALLVLAVNPTALVALATLVLVGAGYGALIAAYPVAVYDRFGAAASARVYGRVFSAWGLAGLIGPWGAGWLYDTTGDYSMAMLLAAVISLVSATCIRCRSVGG